MSGNKRGLILQERDRSLFGELSVMRVVDRDQAMRVAGFQSVTRANSRLLALTRAAFLRRFFLGTVGGARKALYALSSKSAELIAVPYRGPRRASDQTLATDFFVTHQLQINEIYCRVKLEPIPVAGAQFLRWTAFHEPLVKGSALIPDGYAEVMTPEKNLACFLEVDLGNESRAVWRKKVEAYLQYAVSGVFAKEFHGTQFRTLVAAHSERRLQSLRLATAEITEKIFWFTTLDAIAKDGLWAPIWLRPTGDTRQALL
ncbi:MAG: replication-relaxation family protein [Acidobacteriaceae bacterium]|nr:replication-relaxation family protein [Acidobacteriaceae bacterium]